MSDQCLDSVAATKLHMSMTNIHVKYCTRVYLNCTQYESDLGTYQQTECTETRGQEYEV